MKYTEAADVKEKIEKLILALTMTHLDKNRIHCIRSYGTHNRAIARIWGMPKLFTEVVGIEAHYIIEVIHERYDKQSPRDQIKTLIHELMHIPKTFSGALLSHRGPHHRINDREVEKILKSLEGKTRAG